MISRCTSNPISSNNYTDFPKMRFYFGSSIDIQTKRAEGAAKSRQFARLDLTGDGAIEEFCERKMVTTVNSSY